MTSGRDAIKLTDQEVEGLLAENLKVQVASVGHDGVPHLSTLFYIVRDGRIAEVWEHLGRQPPPLPKS